MKSRTSFFNFTLYKKDITRFAPLWVLYTVGMALLMLSSGDVNTYFVGYSVGGTNRYLEGYANSVGYMIGPLSVMNLVYGILTAQLLFGELFNTRLCNALHAMPIRRETRFVSHMLAGLTFSFVPNLMISLLMMRPMGPWAAASLLWLLGLTLEFLFFFGVAVFAMFCTGNRFAAVLVYMIVNFGAMAALWFASVIFIPMMRGVILDWEEFAYFSPVVRLAGFGKYYDIRAVENTRIFYWEDGWLYLSVCAVVGVVLMAVSLLTYRRRALESAGDFMAVKWLKPVFLLLYTLCVGAFLAVFGSLLGGDTYMMFLIVGIGIGFFTGSMLLERTARVFRLKSFVHLGVLVLLIWLMLQAVQFDVFGIVRYVPNPGSVEKAEVMTYKFGRNEITTSDLAELTILQEAHEHALKEKGCKHYDDSQVYYITYHMKNGRTVKREYTLCAEEEASAKLERLLFSPKKIFGFSGEWEDYLRSVERINVDGLMRDFPLILMKAEDMESLLNCIYQDCENGLMGKRNGTYSQYGVRIMKKDGSVRTLEIPAKSAAYAWIFQRDKEAIENTIKYTSSITIHGDFEEPIKLEHKDFAGLIQAIYADCAEGTLNWNKISGDEGAIYEVRILMSPSYLGNDNYKVFYVTEYARNTYEWIKNYFFETEASA